MPIKKWLLDFSHNGIIHPMLPFLPIPVGNALHDWHADIVFGPAPQCFDDFDELDDLELEHNLQLTDKAG